MAFRSTLATLMVRILVNSTGVHQQFNVTKNQAIALAAKFYLLKSAVDVVVAVFRAATDAAAKLETGFINIERVAERLQGTNFRGAFADFSFARLPGEDIFEVQKTMENIARLGVRGQENLFSLTESIQRFSRITGVASAEAALSLGRLQHLFQFEDQARAVRELGSTIIAVAESLPVTEQEIVSIVSRLGSIGQALGMSAADLIALAAAVKSTGQTTEVSASAMVRALTSISTQTDEFAVSMKLSALESAKLFATFQTSATAGFTEFLRLLRQADFATQTKVLKELGLGGFRAAPAILALAGAIDGWVKAQKVANEAGKEGTEIFSDFALHAKSLRAEITNLSNAWTKLKATFGEHPSIKAIIGAFRLLIEAYNKKQQLSDPWYIGRVLYSGLSPYGSAYIGSFRGTYGIGPEKPRRKSVYVEALKKAAEAREALELMNESAYQMSWVPNLSNFRFLDRWTFEAARKRRNELIEKNVGITTRQQKNLGQLQNIGKLITDKIGSGMINLAGGAAQILGNSGSKFASGIIKELKKTPIERLFSRGISSAIDMLYTAPELSEEQRTAFWNRERARKANADAQKADRARIDQELIDIEKTTEERKRRRLIDRTTELMGATPTVQIRSVTQAWKDAQGSDLKQNEKDKIRLLELIGEYGFKQTKVMMHLDEIMTPKGLKIVGANTVGD